MLTYNVGLIVTKDNSATITSFTPINIEQCASIMITVIQLFYPPPQLTQELMVIPDRRSIVIVVCPCPEQSSPDPEDSCRRMLYGWCV